MGGEYLVRKVVRLKEKIFREYPTDVVTLQRNILIKEAMQLRIENADLLGIRALSREIALAHYRKEG